MESSSLEPDHRNVGNRERIIEAYREYLLMNGHQPASVYAFCKEIGLEEDEFYKHFSNFSKVAGSFWEDMHQKTLDAMGAEEETEKVSIRDRLYLYYTTFFEQLRPHRSFSILSFSDSISPLDLESKHLEKLKDNFTNWASALVQQGIERGEIADRVRLSATYPRVLWLQFLFLLNYWRRDNSEGFTGTISAIDKAVKLSFDLMEKNALDSALDFGKFIFQNR